MPLDERTALSEEATASVLDRNETGVLSLAKGSDPYAIPISYGFDPKDRRFYLRLVAKADSEKREFLEADPEVRFVVHEVAHPTYWSVVAAGTLEAVARDDLTVETVERYGDAKRPLFEIWDVPRRELDVQLYRLEPDTLSGRRIEFEPSDESA